MNGNKLRSKMVLHGDTGRNLAKALGISQQAFSHKLNGKADFTQREIQLIKNRYELSPDEVDNIFFTIKVS